jgi:hypothetical protein
MPTAAATSNPSEGVRKWTPGDRIMSPAACSAPPEEAALDSKAPEDRHLFRLPISTAPLARFVLTHWV